jgi:ArsR family transcriptional regulator
MCLGPDECAEAMRVLADATRLRIVRALLSGEMGVKEIARATGLKPHRVSHHLGRMRPAGLVEATRAGRAVIYEIGPRVGHPWGLDLGCACILFRSI